MHDLKLPRVLPNKIALLILISLIGVCSASVLAQSGRRVRKSTVATPTETPEPTPTPAAKTPDKPALPVVIGMDSRNSFSRAPLYFYDSVLKACAERLSGRTSLKVEMSSHDLTRGDAVKRAKSETQGYVVLLELGSDDLNSGSTREDLASIYVQYTVFTATTGKQAGSGKTYQGVGGYKDVLGGSGGSTAYIERRLIEASREAGDRILAIVK